MVSYNSFILIGWLTVTSEMEEESRSGLTALAMKAIGRTTKQTEEVV